MLLIQSSSNYKNLGFTIVELVVVILIVGILSASVGPRFFGAISYKERKVKDDLLSALRYSQQVAMNRGGDIEFILTSKSFTVQRSGGESLRSPDGITPYTTDYSELNNVTLFATNTSTGAGIALPLQLNYTGLGQPINRSAVTNFDAADSKNFPGVQIKINNPGLFNVTIEPETGYAH